MLGNIRNARTILFALLILAALINAIRITPFVISDADPSTYAIVPMLMLPIFALFMYKEKMVPKVDKRDIAAGSLFFSAFILLSIYLNVKLSVLFLSYGIEMLLLPLFIASIATLLFGIKNIKKFYPIMFYALVSSSIIISPIFSLNSQFAESNSRLVFAITRIFVPSAAFYPPFTINANGGSIGIGESCAGISFLISILFFVSPVAYLYNGKWQKKFIWILLSLAILLLLNFARMVSIASVWLSLGPSAAVSFVHSFAGILLFYASIIIVMLLAPRMGLRIQSVKSRKTNAYRKTTTCKALYASGAIAILFTIISLSLSLGYLGAYLISPYYLKSPSSLQSLHILQTGQLLKAANFSAAEVSYNNTSASLLLYHANATIGLYLSSSKNISTNIQRLNNLNHEITFLGSDGMSAELYAVPSNGSIMVLYHTFLPFIYRQNSTVYLVNAYALLPANEVEPSACRYNGLYTYAYNLFNPSFYNSSSRALLSSGYCIIHTAIG